MRGRTKALSLEAAHRLRLMYEELDADGGHRWSVAQLATLLGIGETTAWRAINRMGPYRGLPEVKNESQIDRDAAESAQRLLERLPPELQPRDMAPDPLEGAAGKMARQIKMLKEIEQVVEGRADKLLDELKGEDNGAS